MAEQRLQDKVALVTGAGSRTNIPGTGQATAVLFARHGARVLLVDADGRRAGETLVAIARDGGQASVFQADITDEAACQAMVQECTARYGGLDILFNNVAIHGSGDVTQLDADAWDGVLDTNLKAMILTCKYAVPAMRAVGGGSIINIASVDGLRGGMARNIPYAVSKGGVVTLTRHMAVHHGRQQIRVNCIAPGLIHGAFVSGMTDTQRRQRRAIAPLGTEGTAWDVAYAALFLASDEARWISGVVLPVDAGLTAAAPQAVLEYLTADDLV